MNLTIPLILLIFLTSVLAKLDSVHKTSKGGDDVDAKMPTREKILVTYEEHTHEGCIERPEISTHLNGLGECNPERNILTLCFRNQTRGPTQGCFADCDDLHVLLECFVPLECHFSTTVDKFVKFRCEITGRADPLTTALVVVLVVFLFLTAIGLILFAISLMALVKLVVKIKKKMIRGKGKLTNVETGTELENYYDHVENKDLDQGSEKNGNKKSILTPKSQRKGELKINPNVPDSPIVGSPCQLVSESELNEDEIYSPFEVAKENVFEQVGDDVVYPNATMNEIQVDVKGLESLEQEGPSY